MPPFSLFLAPTKASLGHSCIVLLVSVPIKDRTYPHKEAVTGKPNSEHVGVKVFGFQVWG